MAATKIEICQQALVMIGASPISSFDDGTTEAIACENMYAETVKNELALYRWRFATAMQLMSRLEDAPATKWDAAYQLPAEMLVPYTVYVNSVPINFDRYEDMIFCDAASTDEVYIEGLYNVAEQFWPPYFTMLIILRMAALLVHSIGAQVDTSDLLDRRAGRQGAIARARDAQGRTAPRFDTTRLISNRFRGGVR